MSQESSSEKTEEATPKKLRDAKRRGQVPRSNDIASGLILLFSTIYFFTMWDWLVDQVREYFLTITELIKHDFDQALQTALKLLVEKAFYTIALPFAIMVTIAGILGNILQFGFIFSFDPVMPRLSKVSPSEGFKRIFSVKQVVQTALSLLKTIVIAIAVISVVYMGMGELLNDIQQCDVLCTKEITEDLVQLIFMIVIPMILTIAILDFAFQRAQFMKEQRMTKDELKREMKEMFGDPHVRGARRSLRQELAEQDIQSRIKTARLLIIDIGVAVALHFEQDKTPLPLIVAIGKDGMARKMVEIAQVEDVPLISDAHLVADLIEEGKLDQYIPDSTINRVAQAMRRTSKQ